MKFKKQKEFKAAKPETVIKHLKGVKRDIIKVDPSSLLLKIGNGKETEGILLAVSNGSVRHFPVRETFILKLLKWYNFPAHLLSRLSTETIVSTANDFLLNIRSGNVFVKLENEEALTITSKRYADFPDLEILQMCQQYGINTVTRNDFFMSMNSNIISKKQPVKGDYCGFGFNIINSETGFASLQASHYILRYICSNGAMVKLGTNDNKRKPLVHYNLDRDEIVKYLDVSLKEIRETGEEMVKKLSEINSLKSTEILEKTRKGLSGILGFTEAAELIKKYILYTESKLKDFDGSQYALFNFITSQAKKYDIYKKTQMEHLAGNLFLNNLNKTKE